MSRTVACCCASSAVVAATSFPASARRAGASARRSQQLARRAYIAGVLPNTPQQLSNWIVEPQAFQPGTAMPDMGVSPAHARDMVAYLLTLQ